MSIFPSQNLLTRIDSKYYPKFRLKIAYENAGRIKLIFFITCFFLPLFFTIDYLRIKNGQTSDNIIYQLLIVDHFLFGFMIYTSGLTFIHRKQIKKLEYPNIEKLVSNFITSFIICMLPASFLTIFDRDTLVLFTIYSVILNVILELSHRQSIYLNIYSLIISLVGIIAFYNHDIVKQILTCLEIIAVFGIPFLISRRQYALKLREFEFQHMLNEQNAELKMEMDKSEKLLFNILPEEIAEELIKTGKSEANQFENVTVLFTDFVNFTGISEQLSPKQLVAEIHHCFKGFDEIVERNGLEKIKTIGDAYLAVSGLPKSNMHSPNNVLKAAQEIIDFITNYMKDKLLANEKAWGIRIGINSGPVVAGIVGVKKFAYDIWGDTVNLATEMEQNSQPGKINISESTYQYVKDFYKVQKHQNPKKINGKSINMYYISEE